jgi:hypothetical protein
LGEVEKITDSVDSAAGCAVVVVAWTVFRSQNFAA